MSWICEWYNPQNAEKGLRCCTLDEQNECMYHECYTDDEADEEELL